MLYSRAEAIQRGDKFYRAEKPCPHGHEPKRYTVSSNCVQCTKSANSRLHKEIQARRIARNSREMQDPRILSFLVDADKHYLLIKLRDLTLRMAPHLEKMASDYLDILLSQAPELDVSLLPARTAASITKAEIKRDFPVDSDGELIIGPEDYEMRAHIWQRPDGNWASREQGQMRINAMWYVVEEIREVHAGTRVLANPVPDKQEVMK